MGQEKGCTISGEGKHLKREDRINIEEFLKRNHLKGLLKRYGILSLHRNFVIASESEAIFCMISVRIGVRKLGR